MLGSIRFLKKEHSRTSRSGMVKICVRKLGLNTDTYIGSSCLLALMGRAPFLETVPTHISYTFFMALSRVFPDCEFLLYSLFDFLGAVYFLSSIYQEIKCLKIFDAFITLSAFGSNSSTKLFVNLK